MVQSCDPDFLGVVSQVLPVHLVHEARVMVIRRGGEFSLKDALTEGLALWVRRERSRPRPADNDRRFSKALRLMCCALISRAFDQLQSAVGLDGRITRDTETRIEALGARQWLLSDDRDHPLSYLNCCDVLDLPDAKGRQWVAPYLAVMDGKAFPSPARDGRRAKDPGEDAAAFPGGGDGTMLLTKREEARFREIMAEGPRFRRVEPGSLNAGDPPGVEGGAG